jgi:FkbM family methyltransferase
VRETCPPVIWNAARHLKRGAAEKLARNHDQESAELARLAILPKFAHTTARLLDCELIVTDAPSFLAIYWAYFKRQEYQFRASCENPLIVDCGANVGLGVRYWKQLCPQARVVAYEPDPESFGALQENTRDLAGVTLRQEAVWTESGPTRFAATGADGGHLAAVSQDAHPSQEVTVAATRLRDHLVEPVELLKLDIEGAEVDVLLDCRDRLSLVRNLFVEYHSFSGQPQRLHAFFGVIEQAGFRVHTHPDVPAPQPFMSRPVLNGKDLRMNVFCFRE